jgi:hypothetical protein
MIKVILKPEKGIQIDETKKYLFDPSIVQLYVDASAENATKAEEQANKAEQTFADVSAFVDTSKSEITGIIEQGKTEIATAIDDGRMEISDSILEATEEVKKAGAEAAQEAVQGAADEATRIATEQVNTYVVDVVSPQIQEFVNNAEADASNAAESAGLAAEEANRSSVFASDSQHYAEDARIWAEGEQAEVEPLGGELSSKGWALQASNSATSANQSAIQAKTSEINAKSYADSIEPERLLSKGTITNCITEIPQDIKLELNGGKLTLKAGSKVYVPNGFEADGTTPKFNAVVIASDVVITDSGTSTDDALLVYDDGVLKLPTVANSSYNSTTNKVQDISVDVNYSLPLAIIKRNGTSFTSIDQVFNGFGYIGSNVFMLPNVKGLIPNGRNEDGSLKSVEFTTDGVTTIQTGEYVSEFGIKLENNIPIIGQYDDFSKYYNESSNIVSYNGEVRQWMLAGSFVYSSGKITSFTPKLPFRAVDYNEADFVVESYRNENNWYRVYKSGWVEQGGYCGQGLSWQANTINLLKPYKDTNYTILTSNDSTGSSGGVWREFGTNQNKTATFFKTYCDNTTRKYWQASGQGA